jgi:hypothetical protein
MKSFFIPALESINLANPRLLALTPTSTNVFKTLFNGLLKNAGKEHLVDPELITALTPLLYKFIFEEVYSISAIDFLSKKFDASNLANLENELAQSPTLAKFAQAIISVASFEILDEKGRLQPRLIELFNLSHIVKKVDAVPLAMHFISLYLHRIVIPLLKSTWIFNKSVKQGTLAKVTPKILANQIVISMKRDLHVDNPTKSQTRLLRAIGMVGNNKLASERISSSRMDNLVESMVREICAVPEKKEESSILNALSSIFTVSQSPADYEAEVRIMLRTSYNNDIEEISREMVSFAEAPLNRLVTQMLKVKLNDMKLYGKGLADNFDHHDFVMYLGANPESNDYPIVATDVVTPFPHEITTILATHLHDLMIRKDEGFENSKRLKKFVSRVMLYAYAQVLNEEGEVKEPLRESQIYISNSNGSSKDGIESSLFVSTFIRKLLITVFYEWLSNAIMQNEYNASLYVREDQESPEDQQDTAESHIDLEQADDEVTEELDDEKKSQHDEENGVEEDYSENDEESSSVSQAETENSMAAKLSIIEKKFNAGLSREFLEKIQGFPFNDNNEESIAQFVIPLTITPLGTTTLVDVINEMVNKLELLVQSSNQLAAVLKKFAKDGRPFDPFQAKIEEINEKREKNSRMLTPLRKFKATQEIQSNISAKYAALLTTTTMLLRKPGSLHREFTASKVEAMIVPFANLETTLDEFDKRVEIFNKQVEEATTSAEDLSWSVLTFNSQAVKIQKIEQFCNEMAAYSQGFANQISIKANTAMDHRTYYMKRRDFFPTAIPNSSGWDSDFNQEETQINGSFAMVKGGLQAIKDCCDKLVGAPLAELLKDENSYENLNAQILKTQMEIDRHKIKLFQASDILDSAYSTLHDPIKKAEAIHKEIYGMLRHILRDTSFWKRRVSNIMPGGASFSVGITKYHVPTRAAAMMDTVKQLDYTEINPNEVNIDPDLKIIALLKAYISQKPGWGFWRYNKTIAFYAIVDELITIKSSNLYDLAKMEKIKRQLLDFMRVTCGGPRYTMFQTYQSRVAEKQEEKQSGPISQITAMLSGMVGP